MKKILLALFVVVVNLALPHVAYGQEINPTELESCFDYYDYGKVKLHLGSDKSSYNKGETAVVEGTIVNSNKFPIRNSVLYAQIKRVNKNDNFANNGHYLVGKRPLLTNLKLLSGETKNIYFEIPIEENFPTGDYQLQYFVFSPSGFNYSGRNFIEEDVAGVTNFTVKGDNSNLVYFDPNSLKVNGNQQRVREQLVKFQKGVNNVSVSMNGSIPAGQSIEGSFAFYSFDDAIDSNIAGTEQNFVLNSANNYTLTAQTPNISGAYVFVASIDSPVKSMFKYRFVIDGDDASLLRMNDLGLTNYPPSFDDRAFMCFHSATDRQTPVYNLRLAIVDANDNVIEEKIINGSFGPEVSAISIPLDKLVDRGIFNIKAEMASTAFPGKVQSVELPFSCEDFEGATADFNLNYNPAESSDLIIEGRDGCGANKRVGGVVESIRVVNKDGQVVKEDYNTQITEGKYNLAGLPSGDYEVEVKNGDKVKVLAISVNKKNNSMLMLLWFICLFVLISMVIIYVKRKKVKTAHE